MCKIILLLLCACTEILLATGESICIFTYKDERAKPWDLDSIKSGITGSEEAVPYGFQCSYVSDYLPTLLQAMQQVDKVTVEERKKMSAFVLEKYTWKKIATDRKALFEAACSQELAA